MTTEAQRIAIAEACGWKRKPEFDYKTAKKPDGIEMWGDDTGRLIPFALIPDYLHDLNAMHEAEKVLTEGQKLWFGEAIHRMMKWDYELDEDTQLSGWSVFNTCHVTARPRAEAFLRTLNLWKD